MAIRVLIVEDDLIQQQVLACFLEAEGYYVETAATGLEAMRKVRSESYHIVLMDYVMPDFDGVAAAKIIKRDSTATGYPRLIALTANVAEMLAAESEVGKVFDVLEAKPWSPQSLLRTLQACQAPARSYDESRSADVSAYSAASDRAAADVDFHELQAIIPRGTKVDGADKLKVLLVDDNQMLLSEFKTSLEALDYEVHMVSDRRNALQTLTNSHFDYVLADYLKSSRFCGSPKAFAALRP